MSLTDPGTLLVLPVMRCDDCDGDRPHRVIGTAYRCAACRGWTTGSADARLLAALALIAGALWLCYLAPVVAALVFLPAAVVSALVLVLLLRADRRDRAARDRDVVRSLARPLPPLTREQREAWERLRGQEWTT